MTQEILLRGGLPGGGGVIAERSFCQDSEGWWRWGGGRGVVSQPWLKVETEQRLQGTGKVK